MKNTFQMGAYTVEVIRKKTRYLRLTLYDDGLLRLSAPQEASRAQIQSFLDSKIEWVEKNLVRKRQRAVRPDPFALQDNAFFLWGEKRGLALHYEADKAALERNGDMFDLYLPIAADKPEKYLLQFYAGELRSKAEPLLALWQKKMKLEGVRCSYRAMKSRWGSCTPDTGRIRLNTWLAARPVACLEYVLAHELCHFFERNHGAGFYRLLTAYLPDWESRRQLLKSGGL